MIKFRTAYAFPDSLCSANLEFKFSRKPTLVLVSPGTLLAVVVEAAVAMVVGTAISVAGNADVTCIPFITAVAGADEISVSTRNREHATPNTN